MATSAATTSDEADTNGTRCTAFELLRQRYENCTHVRGNVEINGHGLEVATERQFNNIFKHIEQVSQVHVTVHLQIDGYLLVAFVQQTFTLRFDRLEYIWGEQLWSPSFAQANAAVALFATGLMHVSLPQLKCNCAVLLQFFIVVIANGSIFVYGNSHMCNWRDRLDFAEFFDHYPPWPNNVIMANAPQWNRSLLLEKYHDPDNYGQCDEGKNENCTPTFR